MTPRYARGMVVFVLLSTGEGGLIEGLRFLGLNYIYRGGCVNVGY